MLRPSGLRITVKLPVSSGRKNSSVQVDCTCGRPGEMSGGQLLYLSLGERSELKNVDLRSVTLCGSSVKKMYITAQRMWRGGERERER